MSGSKIDWLLPPSKQSLSLNDVHVWRAKLNQPDGCVSELQRILSPIERQRADRFHFFRDRRRYIVRQGMLRLIIGSYSIVEPHRLQFYCGYRGKPYLKQRQGNAPLQFNLTHSKEIALYALTLGTEIGIDVEYVHDIPDMKKIAAVTYSSAENKVLRSLPGNQQKEAFFNCWVRKEAYIKAIGNGLYHALDRFDVSLAPGEPARIVSVEGSAELASRWLLKSLNPENGYVAAFATKGRDVRSSYWRYPNLIEQLPIISGVD